MKYGESTFDILYLLFAIISGFVILLRAKDRSGKLMGAAALILGCGDAFHLVPRVLNYFSSADLTAALGIGKLVTSVTMTVFYVLLYYVWLERFRVPEDRRMTAALYTGFEHVEEGYSRKAAKLYGWVIVEDLAVSENVKVWQRFLEQAAAGRMWVSASPSSSGRRCTLWTSSATMADTGRSFPMGSTRTTSRSPCC